MVEDLGLIVVRLDFLMPFFFSKKDFSEWIGDDFGAGRDVFCQ